MIETALYAHLMAQEASLGRYLAKYNEVMAIFNQEAPSDQAVGWEEETSQYGRIIFDLVLDDDPERTYSGTLIVDVHGEKDELAPEELEPVVRSLIDGYFFSTEEITMAAHWKSSDYFTETTKKIIGVTLTFGLLAFPKQTTTEPDPIALFNSWTHDELQKVLGLQLRIIGHDTLEAAWKPTNETPAIYWRLGDSAPCGWIPDTYNCSWITSNVHGHVMATDKNTNAIITRKIQNILTLKRRLIFDDQAPLMVDRNIRVNLGNDPLRAGQITIDATYGLLRIPMPGTTLNNTNIQERRSEDD